ncbi:MAG: site-specific tyrosine recombinase/integron integrase [Candidatus Caldatribacteriaceae bacterium]
MFPFESNCNEKEKECLRAYWNYLEKERRSSPHTVENYFRVIVQFIEFLRTEKQRKSFLAVAPQDVRDFFVYLKVHRQLKRISQAHRASALRSFYRFLRRRGFVTLSPCDAVGRLRIEKKLPQFLTSQEVSRILEALKEKVTENSKDFKALRNWALLETLYASGMRVSEIASLKVEDIDFSKMMIRVRGKGGKERLVPFNEASKKALLSYLKVRSTAFPESPFLFLNHRGNPLTPRGIRKIVDNSALLAGIEGKKVFPHIFRHSFATHFLSGGGELRVIQEALGHSSLSTTQMYTHLDWDKMRKVYDNTHPHAVKKVKEEDDTCNDGNRRS